MGWSLHRNVLSLSLSIIQSDQYVVPFCLFGLEICPQDMWQHICETSAVAIQLLAVRISKPFPFIFHNDHRICIFIKPMQIMDECLWHFLADVQSLQLLRWIKNSFSVRGDGDINLELTLRRQHWLLAWDRYKWKSQYAGTRLSLSENIMSQMSQCHNVTNVTNGKANMLGPDSPFPKI